jgi:DNA-binding CsgD family transcriptional regulator
MSTGSDLMDLVATKDGQRSQEPARDMMSEGTGRMAGSTADLYPRLVIIQRLCEASGFALVTAQAQTLLAAGRLDVLIKSPGSEDIAASLIKGQSAFLLKHLNSSPRPLVLAVDQASLSRASLAVVKTPISEPRTDILFPVQLGAMGNGYICCFGARAAIENDLLIDLHRKSLAIMRENLRLTFCTTPVTEKLNEREIECLQLVGNGMKSEAIGERLQLSVHTVNAYLGSATTKLDAVNRIQAIAKAIRLGIIA